MNTKNKLKTKPNNDRIEERHTITVYYNEKESINVAIIKYATKQLTPKWGYRFSATRFYKDRYDYNGKPVEESLAIFQSLKEAEEAARTLIFQLNRGLDRSKILTLSNYIASIIDTELKFGLQSGTHKDKKMIIKNHIVPILGDIEISKTTLSDIKKFRNYLQNKNLSPRTITIYMNILKKIYEHAKQDKKIDSNPCDNIEYPKIKPKEKQYFQTEEIDLFLKHANKESRYYPIYFFMLKTGVRINELLSITWKDIDFGKGTMNINKSRKKEGTIGITKTFQGNRIIPLTQECIVVLQERKASEPPNKLNLVFFNHNNQGYYWYTVVGLNLKKEIQSINKQHNLDLPIISNHCLRHTFATQLMKAKVSFIAIQKTLGHADIKSTMVYQHMLEEYDEEVRNAIESIGKPKLKPLQSVKPLKHHAKVSLFPILGEKLGEKREKF